MNLYDLTGIYLDALEEMEDPAKNGNQKYLDDLAANFDKKVYGYAKVVKCLEAKSESIDKEIKRLQARKKKADESADEIKAMIKECMLATGKKKIPTDLFDISIRKSPDKLIIDNEDHIPDEFFVVQTKVDKKGLNKWAKENKNDVPSFGHYEPSTSVIIS